MGSAARVGDLLEHYAGRGVFRAFSRQSQRPGGAEFRLRWHRDQVFQWVWSESKQTLRIGCVLPAVPSNSPMYREFRAWLAARQDDTLPAHRRCDRGKVALKTYNRGGDVALTMTVLDADVDYAVNKLVALVNEIYLDFLSSGLYFDWLVETFELDPDHPY
ncbi:MAG: hypothetical protein OEV88_03695 [Gammaproteobacteria bacterium]|jgi:hypothetical protein|nr:hypothetical protein [Gammaproteobacteria bacterium]